MQKIDRLRMHETEYIPGPGSDQLKNCRKIRWEAEMSQKDRPNFSVRVELQFAVLAVLCVAACVFSLARHFQISAEIHRDPASEPVATFTPPPSPPPQDRLVAVLSLRCSTDAQRTSLHTKAQMVRLEVAACGASKKPDQFHGINLSNHYDINGMKNPKSNLLLSSFFQLEMGKNEIVLDGIGASESKQKLEIVRD